MEAWSGRDLAELTDQGRFVERHVGPDADACRAMLAELGLDSVDELLERAVPADIRQSKPPELPEAASETQVLDELRRLAGRNQTLASYIGLGYHGTLTPPVIQRNVLEDPAWYTAYTPYQSEISQGRLEALLVFQTMIADLTGKDLVNASLLDEATAAAEAMALCRRVSDRGGGTFVVDADCHPQTIAVVRTRAEPLGLRVHVTDPRDDPPGEDAFGVLLQQPGSSGRLHDGELIADLSEQGLLTVVAADLLSLALITPPGEQGADVVVGSAQRFGVPMAFGGPHAAFLATDERHRRSVPGRIVGVSVDETGRESYRLALQTREQHIRRERATSNICTSQVLLAVVAAMYGIYHGPEGLERIAERVAVLTGALAAGLRTAGIEIVNDTFFDTLTLRVPGRAGELLEAAREAGYNLRHIDDDTLAVALDETTTGGEVDRLLSVFGLEDPAAELPHGTTTGIPSRLRRTSEYLTDERFHRYRSETAMRRYLRRLSDRDVALDRSMIPLGSCTMKLNATTEMLPVTWPGFTDLHPLAPVDQARGYLQLIDQLEGWLAELTGYHAVSLQPNAGSQGELAGLLAIRAYHRERDESRRVVCLIPESAHGTNAASATMAGLEAVVVACDADGNIDTRHLEQLVDQYHEELAALMVTYPSTHGVYETTIRHVCELVHDHGGQVYLDGANLNALLGVARPGDFGADVSQLNLHKTFCIPHGGGGPGVGPVAVAEHLAPHLPSHPLAAAEGVGDSFGDSFGDLGPISQAPWGSAGILPVSWAYIRLMGRQGLTRATEVAVLAANYLASRLDEHYPVLYRGAGGAVAHECVLDLREITDRTGITNEDVAKRLIDYGLHAPTMSFPVAGTLMVEPTESEPKAELDRFCGAMIAIRGEIDRVGSGQWPEDDNPLVNAPHTAEQLAGDWSHPYTREEAAFPAGVVREAKYWPPVGRVDNAYGDRNLMCTCPPLIADRPRGDESGRTS